ncbi:hypothetical protein [Arthrobacter sp. GMC3]|uniref:hypothetical protein n=1 Tax=Arthrobacter sp. GMC3 TaxID=2058894 RepID=UPI000CE32C31|nr:hypothetical protein [Arthrobacter sp. GMC3]
MPENDPEHDFLAELRPMGFVGAKNRLIEWAMEAGERLSVRDAKSIAGAVVNAADMDDYKRITHGDPVGEGVARRWFHFKHNLEVVAA